MRKPAAEVDVHTDPKGREAKHLQPRAGPLEGVNAQASRGRVEVRIRASPRMSGVSNTREGAHLPP